MKGKLHYLGLYLIAFTTALTRYVRDTRDYHSRSIAVTCLSWMSNCHETGSEEYKKSHYVSVKNTGKWITHSVRTCTFFIHCIINRILCHLWLVIKCAIGLSWYGLEMVRHASPFLRLNQPCPISHVVTSQWHNTLRITSLRGTPPHPYTHTQ